MEEKIVATNKKAFHTYHILDKFEAGIELKGSEVKSIREGKANLKEGYVTFRDREAVLVGMHISAYSHTGFSGHEPTRERRLLLHKRQLLKLKQKTAEKGLTIVPLRLYFKGSWAKVELALVKGKKFYEKKERIKSRDIERDTAREIGKIV
jgi:SsrA-binding protein